jgi:hypothetical protein
VKHIWIKAVDPKLEETLDMCSFIQSIQNNFGPAKISGKKSDVYICKNCQQIGLAIVGEPIGQHPPLVSDCAETIVKNIMEL